MGTNDIIAVIMIIICCPLTALVCFLISTIVHKIFFKAEADLTDVMFSKERIEQVEKGDLEQDNNIVSIEEAISVSDFKNQRELMMNILKKDVSQSLGSIAQALNSEDSETSHYAATALRDELGSFRSKIQTMYSRWKEQKRKKADDGHNLLQFIYPMIRQDVFPVSEQSGYVIMMDDVLKYFYYNSPSDMQSVYYEWIVERCLAVGKDAYAKQWCERAQEKLSGQLTSYKCWLKYYYYINDSEKFIDTIKKLKSSDIAIDSETLEIIRIFS